MNNTKSYCEILTAVVKRQFGILGVEKALDGAREAELEVLDNGTVTSFTGDGDSMVKRLIDCYVEQAGLTPKIGSVMLARKVAKEHGITLHNL